MYQNKVAIIQNQQIRALDISPEQCIEWIEQSFSIKYDSQLPAKISVHPQGEDFFTSMPCLLPERYGRFGMKLIHRIQGEEPSLGSDILLYDSRHGHLLAIIDGDWITTMRTGAVAALAVRLFEPSRPAPRTYSIMGLGNTARATALCLLAEHPDEAVCFRLLRYKDQAEQFIERFKDYEQASFEIIDNVDEFIGEADVVVSCITAAQGKLVCPNDELYRPGMLLVPVHTRGFQNCDLFFDKVFADDTAHVQGFRYFSQFKHFCEMSQVVLKQSPGREREQERILCYNIGLGLHDVLFASKVYDLIGTNTSEVFVQQKESKKFWI